MPRFLIRVAPWTPAVIYWSLGRIHGPIEARDAEHAARLAAEEWLGPDGAVNMKPAGTDDGIPLFRVGDTVFAVERLTP